MILKTNFATLFIFLLAIGCEEEDCVKVTNVTTVFRAALEYPENFDGYATNMKFTFDDNFYRCLDQRLLEIMKSLDKETAECDELDGGSESWVDCYNENIRGLENLLTILSTIKKVTKGEVRWAETTTGLSVIVMKSSDPELLQHLIDTFNEHESEAYCMICESKRCFLGICW